MGGRDELGLALCAGWLRCRQPESARSARSARSAGRSGSQGSGDVVADGGARGEQSEQGAERCERHGRDGEGKGLGEALVSGSAGEPSFVALRPSVRGSSAMRPNCTSHHRASAIGCPATVLCEAASGPRLTPPLESPRSSHRIAE